MKIIRVFLVLFVVGNVLAQEPDKRGVGVEKPTPTPNSQTTQAREAKPELVLQTGYNNIFGATRLVFSPDARLLAPITAELNLRKVLRRLRKVVLFLCVDVPELQTLLDNSSRKQVTIGSKSKLRTLNSIAR